MASKFIEGGGWPDPAEKETLEDGFEVSLASLFLLGLTPSLLALIVLGMKCFQWLSPYPAPTLLSVWGWLGLGVLVCEVILLLILRVRCQEKGIAIGEVINLSLGYGPGHVAGKHRRQRSYREVVEEMRRLYGTNS